MKTLHIVLIGLFVLALACLGMITFGSAATAAYAANSLGGIAMLGFLAILLGPLFFDD